MKKTYLIAAGIILVILIVISIFLSSRKKSTINNLPDSPFPTSVPSSQSLDSTNSTDLTDLTDSTDLTISAIAPIETEDFKLQYSPKLNKIVVEKKTPQAEQQFINWASQNQQTQLIENPALTLIVDSGQNPDDFNPMIEFLNIFMNFGQGVGSNVKTDSTDLTDSTDSTNPLTPNPSSFAYFPQCGEFGNVSLPGGCNLCQAGCGPSTVAMIAASYLGGNITPKTIVDQYQSKGYLLSCAGSSYADAKQVLEDMGLKTTDYLVFNTEKSDTVVPDLRKYLSGGWTFFTLASFCDGGCGHYFWITDIDSQGNIFAYDSAYGRFEIPYNENSRYPYPLYRLAFGVKR